MINNDIIRIMQDIGRNRFSLGMRIRFLREFRGMTQQELGIMCGFSVSTASTRIAQYESDSKYPRLDVIGKLKEALEIQGNMLMDLDNNEGVSLVEDFMLMLLWGGIYELISPRSFLLDGIPNPDLRSKVEMWAKVYDMYQDNMISKEKYLNWMLQSPFLFDNLENL